MFLKFKITQIGWPIHKQVHHIMLVLKFGGIKLMTVNQTFGL